jgi:antitoxin component YwqK of YwqJK toxin-antitoxin module
MSKKSNNRGFIYVLSNKAFADGMVKIGKSLRNPVDGRSKELFTTGVPGEFVVEYAAYVNSYSEIEFAIHKKLEKCRYSKNREFFNISLVGAIEESIKVIGNRFLFHNYNKTSDRLIIEEGNAELTTYFKNGRTKLIRKFRKDRLNYRYTEYYNTGKLKESCNVVSGLKYGLYKRYDRFGKLLGTGQMVKGLKHGMWSRGNEPKVDISYFDMGRPVLYWQTYDENGQKVTRYMGEPSQNYEDNMVYKGAEMIEMDIESGQRAYQSQSL